MIMHKHYFYWLLVITEINTYVHLELKVLGNWAQSLSNLLSIIAIIKAIIINHLYWAIFTCNKNGKELIKRFLSLKHHIVNKHTLPQNTYYNKFADPPLSTKQSQRKQWLEMGSTVYEKLVNIISEKTLVADLEHMTKQVNTTLPEVFHAKKMSCLPNSTLFRMEKMVAGTQIAALDHKNINRSQVSKFLHIWNNEKICFID